MTRETFLMAIRDEEAEPTVIEVDETSATLVLDDGERLVFNATELRAALAVAPVAS